MFTYMVCLNLTVVIFSAIQVFFLRKRIRRVLAEQQDSEAIPPNELIIDEFRSLCRGWVFLAIFSALHMVLIVRCDGFSITSVPVIGSASVTEGPREKT